ncbi:MAG: ribonuclease HII [Akkermansiaceae bacterium]|nr:ribonuclease HII [Akkermansiaceae bacterium]
MPDLKLESRFIAAGYARIAGIDEAGRGPLAGPVVAAAVILPKRFKCEGLNDSKKLSANKREQLYQRICGNPEVIWASGSCSCEEIDQLNILRATHLAMRRATEALHTAPDHCLIDGLPVRDFPLPFHAEVKGDSKSLSIAAASIIAKVTRDRLMREIDQEFPAYGFARHQGYGTKEHLEALRTHGPCLHHRRSFQPVAQLTLPLD